jgi:hypothetical protein
LKNLIESSPVGQFFGEKFLEKTYAISQDLVAMALSGNSSRSNIVGEFALDRHRVVGFM